MSKIFRDKGGSYYYSHLTPNPGRLRIVVRSPPKHHLSIRMIPQPIDGA
jgi:hypothetical protein